MENGERVIWRMGEGDMEDGERVIWRMGRG